MKKLILVASFLLMLGPDISKAQLGEEFTVISSYETYFGDYGRYRGRADNIRKAVNELSTIILQPDEQFSFNETLGPRTKKAGYKRAPVISGGEMITGYGGGICQVASTIHAAALYAGLEIIEAHQHSRISSYVDPGLDAAVNYGTKDLIIKNHFSFPIKIAVSYLQVAENAGRVDVKIYAREEPYDYVNIRIVEVVRERPEVEYITDEDLSVNQSRVIQPGTPEMYVRRIRERIRYAPILFNDVDQDERVYRASKRIVARAPN